MRYPVKQSSWRGLGGVDLWCGDRQSNQAFSTGLVQMLGLMNKAIANRNTPEAGVNAALKVLEVGPPHPPPLKPTVLSACTRIR
jgi:hypothetical protein